jgi:hypothetical protein
MADKSPRQRLSQKAAKSLKQKRADKQTNSQGKNRLQDLPPDKKR